MKRASDYEAANAVDEVILHRPFSRRAFLASPLALALSPAVLAGLGLMLAPTPASATTFDSWVLMKRSESSSAVQSSYYYIHGTPNSDGSWTVDIRTDFYNKNAAYIFWTTTKTIYDNGNRCAYIGADWNSRAYKGQTISQSTSFRCSGGGSHHITSIETGFRYSSATEAGWDFWIELPYTGKITIDVRAIAKGNHVIPDGDYVIRYRDNTNYCVALGTTNNAPAVQCGNKTPQLRWFNSSVTEMYWHLDYAHEDNANTFHVRPLANLLLGLETPNAVSTSCRAGLWHVNGNPHHWWHLAKDSSGNFELLAGHNISMALDLANANVAGGNPINVHPRNSTAAQRWKLQLVRRADGSAITDYPSYATKGPNGLVYVLENASCQEIARVTMSGRQATFNKLVKSTDMCYVRMLSAPAGIRLDTTRRGVRLCQNGDTAFLTYEIEPAYVKVLTVNEDNVWTTVAAAMKVGWAGQSFVLTNFHAKTWYYGGVPSVWSGRANEYYGQCWGVYDRDPKTSGATMVGGANLTSAITFIGTKTLVTRLPNTVTAYMVKGSSVTKICSFPMKAVAWSAADVKTRLRNAGVISRMDSEVTNDGWYHQVYSNQACTAKAFNLDASGWTWAPGAHANIYLKVKEFTVTYVVDGATMATDKVLWTNSWTIPATRTTQATKKECTPGFSGWHRDGNDLAITADNAGQGGSSKVTGAIAVKSDITLYGTNRATITFGIDARSTANVAEGEVRRAPDDSAAEATDKDKGCLDAMVRRVNRTAALSSLTANLYKKTAGGRYVTCKPDAWYLQDASASTRALTLAKDTHVGVIWQASTNDGVSAER